MDKSIAQELINKIINSEISAHQVKNYDYISDGYADQVLFDNYEEYARKSIVEDVFVPVLTKYLEKNISVSKNDLQTMVFALLQYGESKTIKSLLRKGLDTSIAQKESDQLMSKSIIDGDFKLVKNLVSYGIKIPRFNSSLFYYIDKYQDYALLTAENINVLPNDLAELLSENLYNEKIFEFLIDNGADINKALKKVQSITQFNYLINKGASLSLDAIMNIYKNNRYKKDILKFIRKLESECPDFDKQLAKQGAHYLQHFSEDVNLNIDIIKYLLYHGVNPNTVDQDGNSLLHKAVEFVKEDNLKNIMNFKVNPYIRNNLGQSVIEYAKEFKEYAITAEYYSKAPLFAEYGDTLYLNDIFGSFEGDFSKLKKLKEQDKYQYLINNVNPKKLKIVKSNDLELTIQECINSWQAQPECFEGSSLGALIDSISEQILAYDKAINLLEVYTKTFDSEQTLV